MGMYEADTLGKDSCGNSFKEYAFLSDDMSGSMALFAFILTARHAKVFYNQGPLRVGETVRDTVRTGGTA